MYAVVCTRETLLLAHARTHAHTAVMYTLKSYVYTAVGVRVRPVGFVIRADTLCHSFMYLPLHHRGEGSHVRCRRVLPRAAAAVAAAATR